MLEFLPIDCNNDRPNKKKHNNQLNNKRFALVCCRFFVVISICFFSVFRIFRSFIAFAWFKEKIMHSSIKGLTKLIKDDVERMREKKNTQS